MAWSQFAGAANFAVQATGTTWTWTTWGTPPQVGDLLVLQVEGNGLAEFISASDNSAQAGTANTYTLVGQNSPGGGNNGYGAMLFSILTRPFLSGTTVTATKATSITGRTGIARIFRSDQGAPIYQSAATKAVIGTLTSGYSCASTVSVPAGNLVVTGAYGIFTGGATTKTCTDAVSGFLTTPIQQSLVDGSTSANVALNYMLGNPTAGTVTDLITWSSAVNGGAYLASFAELSLGRPHVILPRRFSAGR